MELSELQARIDHYISLLPEQARQDLKHRLAELTHAYPFSAFDYMLMYLQHRGVLSFNSYEDLRAIYVTSNPHLALFEQDPRQFGQDWGVLHLIALHPELRRADRSLDPDFKGQYDLWLDGIRIGVRAARAVDAAARGSLVEKALRYGVDRPYFMNFQQLDLEHTDAFVFIGVWVDTLVYWMLQREEVETNKYLIHQRRGGVDFQISLKSANLDDFNQYLARPEALLSRIRQEAGQ